MYDKLNIGPYEGMGWEGRLMVSNSNNKYVVYKYVDCCYYFDFFFLRILAPVEGLISKIPVVDFFALICCVPASKI